MGKNGCKIVVFGQSGVGKTALIEQLIYGNHIIGTEPIPTIEDVYTVNITSERESRERVSFYDTAGLNGKVDFPKHYLSYVDGYALVYDVTSRESFESMDRLKREIDKSKEKKDSVVISLGNKCDLKDARVVDFHSANKWAQKEKVRLWEVSVINRQSLIEPFIWLTTKLTQPQNRSAFPLGMGMKKSKQLNNLDN